MNRVKYKGKTIHPYESFYWNTTQELFRGQLGGGIARCVKCDDCLATMVMDEAKVIVEGYYTPSKHNASRILNTSGISPR